jgi:hypothetical protein
MRAPTFSNLCVDVKAREVSSLLDGGWLYVFDGEQPESADDNVSTQVLLVRLRLKVPAFLIDNTVDGERGGVMRLNPPDSQVIISSGRPTWFRCTTRGDEPIFDGTVGREGYKQDYDMIVDGDGALEAEGEFRLRSLTYREAKR